MIKAKLYEETSVKSYDSLDYKCDGQYVLSYDNGIMRSFLLAVQLNRCFFVGVMNL